MVFDKQKFRAAVVAKGLTLAAVAATLDINVATLSRKINGHSDFYLQEIQKLCDVLEIPEPKDIFFA